MLKISFQLSILVTFFATLASAAGIFLPGLYQDNDFVRAVWLGNDWVTLLVIVPAMTIVLYLSHKGSIKAQLIRMGLLGYFLYNYAFYLFGAVFNPAFLLYVAIYSLSHFALITGLIALPVNRIKYASRPVPWISAYLGLIAIILCVVEIPPTLNYIFTGKIPEIVRMSQHPTSIVYALDLSIVAPVSILALVLLRQGNPWGGVLAAIMLVKGATYGLVLVLNTLLLKFSGIADDPLLPFYCFIAIGGMVGLFFLLRPVQIDHGNSFAN